jgi:hypothetical protein
MDWFDVYFGWLNKPATNFIGVVLLLYLLFSGLALARQINKISRTLEDIRHMIERQLYPPETEDMVYPPNRTR